MAGDDAYQRGPMQGDITARLAGHDQHFDDINGSIEKLVREVHETNRHLGDVITASQLRDERALAVAATLEKATNDRREADNNRWLRTQRAPGCSPRSPPSRPSAASSWWQFRK